MQENRSSGLRVRLLIEGEAAMSARDTKAARLGCATDEELAAAAHDRAAGFSPVDAGSFQRFGSARSLANRRRTKPIRQDCSRSMASLG